MSQQMQSVPAHLRPYISSGRPTYIPQHVQKELTSFMQNSSPAHLKQYAGAFVEQNVVTPAMTINSGPPRSQAPMPDRLNQSHSGSIAAEQGEAKFYNNLFQADPSAGQPSPTAAGQSNTSYEQPSALPDASGGNYDFILNPKQPKRFNLFNFNGSSLPMRIVVILGGLLLIFIIFSVIKGALSGGNTAVVPDLVGLVQDQQELIQVTSDGTQNASDGNVKNFAYTAYLTLKSEQSQLVSYLQQADKHKVSKKEAALKLNAAVQQQLAASLASSSYDSTFTTIIQSQLQAYQKDLQQTYLLEKGPVGRSLLNNDYKATQLLLKQLNS